MGIRDWRLFKSLVPDSQSLIPMQLLVGLGNPGPEYAGHRHNIGFMAIDAIAHKLGAQPFKSKFKALYSEAIVEFGGAERRPRDSEGERSGGVSPFKVILIKPQTFMNRSGSSVSEACTFYKIPLENVFIFHDELDVALGKIKTKQGGSAAGHNGLKSIDSSIGNNYARIRIGISHPGNKDMVSDYVLSNFKKDEMMEVEKVVSAIAENIPSLVKGSLEIFSNNIALKL